MGQESTGYSTRTLYVKNTLIKRTDMKFIAIMTLLLICVPLQAKTKTEAEKQKCSFYTQKIKEANDRLKAGYKEPTGNRMREQIKKYSDLKWRECR